MKDGSTFDERQINFRMMVVCGSGQSRQWGKGAFIHAMHPHRADPLIGACSTWMPGF